MSMAQEPLVWDDAMTRKSTLSSIATVPTGTKAERVTRRRETCTE